MAESNNVFDYIEALPSEHRSRLYKKPMFCVPYLKIMSKQMSALIFDLVLSTVSISSLKKDMELKNTLKKLIKIHLIERQNEKIALSTDFRASLLTGFSILNMDCHFVNDNNAAGQKPPSCSTSNGLENVLKYLVNNTQDIYEYKIKEVLIYGELLDQKTGITNKGFEFLLKPRKSQLWFLVLLSMKFHARSIDDELDCLEMIFELSNKKTNWLYKINKPVNIAYLCFLQSLGLLSLENGKLVLDTAFMLLFGNDRCTKQEFLIVETNYKVYAYTTSDYEISTINLFCDIVATLPNLAKGVLTEASVNRAFNKGITSKQIISYLKSTIKNGTLASTVSKQIVIWESKRKRIFMTPSYMYSEFLNLSDFQKVLEFCRNNDFIVGVNYEKRIIIVKASANEDIKAYIRSII